MAKKTAAPPELLQSQQRLQSSLDAIAQQLDDNRVHIPGAIMAHIQASSPDPEALALIQQWQGHVLDARDHAPRQAFLALNSLPSQGDDVAQWWLDQIGRDQPHSNIRYTQILPEHTPEPQATTVAAFSLIRSVLSHHSVDIPNVTRLADLSGNRVSRILFDYARLRHLARHVADAELPEPPHPSLLPSVFAGKPDVVIDVGEVEDVHAMAARSDWRGHEYPPTVCPTCDVWVGNDPMDVGNTSRHCCPYCWSTPMIPIGPSTVPPSDPVDLIFHLLAPQPYGSSHDLYARVAEKSSITPWQAYEIMHPGSEPAPEPQACPVRDRCTTECAESTYPYTKDGSPDSCRIEPFLQRSADMNPETAAEYAVTYLEQLRAANRQDRRASAARRKAAGAGDEPAEETQEKEQPTLF